MTDWRAWRAEYDRPESSLARRLAVVRRYIGEALVSSPPGPIRVISMCAGDGRDLLGVLPSHARGKDVSGRLVELDAELGRGARTVAPPGIDVVCEDAGVSDSYAGAIPADLLLSCGILGNVSKRNIRRTIESWSMFCKKGATVIWTRGASEPDLRDTIRGWVKELGFKELAFDGAPEKHGVGMARMTRDSRPFVLGHRFFEFLPDRVQSDVSAYSRVQRTPVASRLGAADAPGRYTHMSPPLS